MMSDLLSSECGMGLMAVVIVLLVSCVWLLLECRRRGNEQSASRNLLDDERAKVLELTSSLSQYEERILSYEQECERLRLDKDLLDRELEQKAGRLDVLGAEREAQDRQLDRAQIQLAFEREKLEELRNDFLEQKHALKSEFRILSEGILKERQDDLQKTSKEGIAAILDPLKEEISGFKKRVETVHSESKDGQGQLREHLSTLKEMNRSLSTRAENLANALRNDKKTLGNWGEVQVERLLENAGFDQSCYRREQNFKTAEGANQRPDFVVDLPEQKALIIDSKVSLNAYVDSVNADTEEEALAYMKAHTTNVRNHIKSLAEKSYMSLAGINAPDFVFMFMPIESAYLAAFEEDASLFDFAYDRKIAVVTPNTLLPILKTVQSLWRIDKQNKSSEALAYSAANVHKKMMIFLEKFADIEKKMMSLQSSFSVAKTTLTTGKGNLLKLASEFEELGVRVVKAVPAGMEN